MLERLAIDNREDWLKARDRQGLGGSDAAAVAGLSKWKSSSELYLEKSGLTPKHDISESEVVKRGVAYEPALRSMYIAGHPEDEVEYHPYDILFQSERPWLFATLDGEIIRGTRRGILEIKTASIMNARQLEEWNGRIPDGYFCQNIHQLLATGYDFVVLYAALFMWDGSISIREYEFTRDEVEADMNWLFVKEDDFMRSLSNKEMPKMTIRL